MNLGWIQAFCIEISFQFFFLKDRRDMAEQIPSCNSFHTLDWLMLQIFIVKDIHDKLVTTYILNTCSVLSVPG